MLTEAIAKIEKLALEGANAEKIEGVLLRNASLINIGNELHKVNDEPQKLNLVAGDLESFLAIVEDRPEVVVSDFHSEGDDAVAIESTKPPASIWHYENQIIGILADIPGGFRDDRVRLQLESSTKFAKLTKEASQMRKHPEFVAFVVENFRDELNAAAPTLLATLRSLRFVNNSAGQSTIQQGRESYGREVENAITGAEALPETVILRVPRWSTLPFVTEVECLLKLNPTSGELALRPLADQLAAAELKAQAFLHEQLSVAKDVPVYHGCP